MAETRPPPQGCDFNSEAKNVVREYRLRKAAEHCKGNKRETILVSIRRLKLLGKHDIRSNPQTLQRIPELNAVWSARKCCSARLDDYSARKVHPRRAALGVFEIDDTSCKMESTAL